jgi:hypothetical protein
MNFDLGHKLALERQVDLLARIDIEQAALKRDGYPGAIALKNVLKAYDISARMYWNMCQVANEYKETEA